jgi:hypothetical protein
VVSYRVMLDVPRDLILFVSGLLAAHRREIGTRKGTRRLGCYGQALFGLAWFRDKGPSCFRRGTPSSMPVPPAVRSSGSPTIRSSMMKPPTASWPVT